VRDDEFRQRLEDIHRRLDGLVRELDDIRAEITVAAVDVDNRLAFTQLHAGEVWNERRAAPSHGWAHDTVTES
jgi:hypothetical protein